MHYWLAICFIVSFIVTILVIPYWIKRSKEKGLVGQDMHKLKKINIAEAGGICVVFGFFIGASIYVAFETFFFKVNNVSLTIMAVLLAVLIATVIGLIDDLLGWKKGLKQWQKPLLTLLAAIPMIVLNVGTHVMRLPFFGEIDVGLIYPLIFIPIGIVGASNAFNLLAGYNGLEAGLGAIILTFLAYVAYIQGFSWVSIIALCMVFSLLAFYLFNKYPASIFPGDTLTYPVGALIAIVAVLGDMEKVALILFIPYFLEFILKLRGKLKKESFAKLNEDGSLSLPYDKIYGLEHVMIQFLSKFKEKIYEKDVVWSLFILEIILGVIVILLI